MKRAALTLSLVAACACVPATAQSISIDPAAWSREDWIDLRIEGSPIAAPDTIVLIGPGEVQIHADMIAGETDGISCRIDLTDAPLGPYDLRLVGPGGTSLREPSCFEVLAVAPPAGWSVPQRLTFEPDISDRPVVAADRFGHVHVVWQIKQGESYHVLYRRWNGNGWLEPEMLNPGG